MKRIIQLFAFIFFVSNSYSQNSQLKMKIVSLRTYKNNIELCVEVNNLSNQEIAVYYQNIDQICSNLMYIRFVDTKSNQFHVLFPCTSVPDLNHIELTKNNSLFIDAGKQVSISYLFKKKDVKPYIKKKKIYKVIVGWHFKDIFIKTNFKNYFNDDVESNYVLFKNN